jgi:polar amino acid transport system substrate-binding protein
MKNILSNKREFLFFVFTLLFFSSSLYAKTIILGTTHWPPYVQNSENKGYAYEIVMAAFTQAGYDNVKIIFMPWTDATEAVNSGQLDGIFPEYFSEDRRKNILYTDSFSESPLGFYKRLHTDVHYQNTNPTKNLKNTFDEMTQYRFGVVKDYVNFSVFDNDSALHKIYADSDLDNLNQLYMGKVDLILIDQHVAEYLFYHQFPLEYRENLMFMPPALITKKLYVGISKKNVNAGTIIDDFNKGLSAIKKNGVFNQIIGRDAELTDEHIA